MAVIAGATVAVVVAAAVVSVIGVAVTRPVTVAVTLPGSVAAGVTLVVGVGGGGGRQRERDAEQGHREGSADDHVGPFRPPVARRTRPTPAVFDRLSAGRFAGRRVCWRGCAGHV
jgi:hypothetical protein